mmetsp:Transcript_110604/g.311946  ORF Transcript_110604/g.311946 Transcript_110604/m.311946 type:complete len:86 (-) Transcript_110604:97-354(-)
MDRNGVVGNGARNDWRDGSSDFTGSAARAAFARGRGSQCTAKKASHSDVAEDGSRNLWLDGVRSFQRGTKRSFYFCVAGSGSKKY